MARTFAVCLLALTLTGNVRSKDFIFQNNHGSNIWVGSLGNSGLAAPNNGGFALGPGEQRTVSTDNSWAGRFWARTGCSFDGSGYGPCETGDCGNKLECAGAGGVPPVSLAEFTLTGWGGLDYYDVSLVDGFNVGVQIQPANLGVDPNNPYSCGVAGCSANLDPNCPDALRVYNNAGQVVACKSSCLAFNEDQYCCRGQYGTPETCNPANWPVNSATYFKTNCPGAYSYAYDDTKSTYTCTDGAYRIIFW